MDLQKQIRDNAEDLQTFLSDLNAWEVEMHKKEEEFKLSRDSETQDLPPIRNSLSRSKKNRHKKQKDKNDSSTTQRIRSDDYKAWDKFDVDKEIIKIEGDGNEENHQSSSSDDSENEEEVCDNKRKQLAILNKDKGNDFFKKGNYDSAINCYTTGMQLDPENPLLSANRAMAFIKKEQFQAAENDCTLCLSIDPTYVKAYLRRGTARSKLGKHSLAKEDFAKVLELESDNKQAKAELAKLMQDSSVGVCASNSGKNDFIKEINTHKAEDEKCLKQNVLENQLNSTLFIQTLPPIPSSYFQFLKHWKNIYGDPHLSYQYLKQLPPEKITSLFQSCMDPEILFGILHTLASSFLEHGDDVFYFMKALTKIDRFSTMMMFLGKQEQNDLLILLDAIRNSNRSTSEKEQLLKHYSA